LNNNYQVSCVTSSNHVSEIFTFLWELKVAVVSVLPATEFTVSPVAKIRAQAFANLLIVKDL